MCPGHVARTACPCDMAEVEQRFGDTQLPTELTKRYEALLKALHAPSYRRPGPGNAAEEWVAQAIWDGLPASRRVPAPLLGSLRRG